VSFTPAAPVHRLRDVAGAFVSERLTVYLPARGFERYGLIASTDEIEVELAHALEVDVTLRTDRRDPTLARKNIGS